MRNVYIFDLDDTLYQVKDNQYINKVNKQELRKLNGIKILFSNATFGHVSILMKELGITDIFNVVFTTDILGGYKPNPLMYEKIMTLCNLNESDNIYFFENLAINLYPAKKYNWKVHIPNFSYTTDNAAMIGIVGYLKYLNQDFTHQKVAAKARYIIE